MSRKRIYISGPISKGDRAHNVRQAEDANRALIDAGFAPLCPQLSCYLPYADDIPHTDWLAVDLPWVAVAHAVLRLPGESVGADMECQEARQHGIPVYFTVTDLCIRETGDGS